MPRQCGSSHRLGISGERFRPSDGGHLASINLPYITVDADKNSMAAGSGEQLGELLVCSRNVVAPPPPDPRRQATLMHTATHRPLTVAEIVQHWDRVDVVIHARNVDHKLSSAAPWGATSAPAPVSEIG
jgi:hypothetical protein